MIEYVERGIGLHEAIAAAGYRLEEIDGVWVAWRRTADGWLSDAEADAAVQAIIDAYVPVDPVPESVSRRQLRKALAMGGMLDAVDAYVQSMDPVDRVDWDEAVEYERHHPLMEQGIAALGITPEQADDLWRLAATL